jgi:hypothetical protein
MLVSRRSKAPEPAQQPISAETSSDWTIAAQTRISQRAHGLLTQKLNGQMLGSTANYLRMLIYRDLGIMPGKDET